MRMWYLFFLSIKAMHNHKIKTLTRLLLLVCGLGLILVLFNPIWQITLDAPQYPEGLKMFIHANTLSGDIAIINGLNHYIGMKTLHADDFTEFKVLPAIIITFSALFVIAAIAGKRRWLNILCGLFIAFGIVAMIDFWRWEYDYGHNLNPNAAIIVPGMAYQPPLIGFKQLLNFGAYSMPATGGWIFIMVGLIVVACVVYEWRAKRKTNKVPEGLRMLAIATLSLITLSSCNTGPQPIRAGVDNCDFCKMKISDNRFGAEIITNKNKVYKFDDAHCIQAFVKAATISKKEIAAIYFTNFNEPHDLIKTDQVYLLQSADLKSPMNGNIAAFANEGTLNAMLSKFNGNKISPEEVLK